MSHFFPQLREQFEPVRLIKESSRGSVALVRADDGTQYILRRFSGDGTAYRALQNRESPYLPRIHRVWDEGGHTLVLEEYVAGESLTDRLSRGRMTARDARALGVQLCHALDSLHTRGIVHRDIKPDNVILRNNRAVLVDFDAARLYEPGTAADTQVLGTVGYAAPEQFGLSQSDMRTDIYAMGVLLNVALTGYHPSAGRTAAGPLGRVIRRCTMMNPADRYPSARRLRTVLRFLPWRPWLLTLAGLLAAAGVCAAAWRAPVPDPAADQPSPSASVQPTVMPTPDPTATPAPTPTPTPPAKPTPEPTPSPTPTYTVPQTTAPPNPAVDLSRKALGAIIHPYYRTEYGAGGYECYGMEFLGVDAQWMEGDVIRMTLRFSVQMEFRFTAYIARSTGITWNSGDQYGHNTLCVYPGDSQFSIDLPIELLAEQNTLVLALHNRAPNLDGSHPDIENRAESLIGIPLLLEQLSAASPDFPSATGQRTALTESIALPGMAQYTDDSGFTFGTLCAQRFSDATVTFALTFSAEKASTLTLLASPDGRELAQASVFPGDSGWTVTVSETLLSEATALTVRCLHADGSVAGSLHISDVRSLTSDLS